MVWDPLLRTRSAFELVGTSYWGNACRGQFGEDAESDGPIRSFSVFMRPVERIPAASDTVLYMEMPALFNLTYSVDGDTIQFWTIGVDGWHGDGSKFNFAFCDGRVESVSLPAKWLDRVAVGGGEHGFGTERRIRENGVRFDCYPDAPIDDPPIGAKDRGSMGPGVEQ